MTRRASGGGRPTAPAAPVPQGPGPLPSRAAAWMRRPDYPFEVSASLVRGETAVRATLHLARAIERLRSMDVASIRGYVVLTPEAARSLFRAREFFILLEGRAPIVVRAVAHTD